MASIATPCRFPMNGGTCSFGGINAMLMNSTHKYTLFKFSVLLVHSNVIKAMEVVAIYVIINAEWSIELGKFDIEYRSQIAIKAQVLVDFLVEYTYPEPEELPKEEPKPWVLQVLVEYTVKEEVMQKYVDKVKAQVAKLRSFDIVKIPRKENIEADYQAKLATTKEDAIPRNAPIQYLEMPSIFALDVQVQAINYSTGSSSQL
ncbi:hypothetical protein RHSIM_Rhsim11G0005300 [Rhododendron simsii]|uniref:Uncharacterized protein n=1 Tax=Rhododendron simsii TaxID=118357 RepID=A0A834G920_RHOSS|nr:hypothetical protein RHSIM_Rhsim11G0005300 [Rhododendron simsii]